jgi:hypothetical protein
LPRRERSSARLTQPRFGEALTKVTESEGDVEFLRIDLADEPGAIRIRREEFDDRGMVLIAIAPLGEQLLELRFGEEVHIFSPCVDVRPRWDSATKARRDDAASHKKIGGTAIAGATCGGGTEAFC